MEPYVRVYLRQIVESWIQQVLLLLLSFDRERLMRFLHFCGRRGYELWGSGTESWNWSCQSMWLQWLICQFCFLTPGLRDLVVWKLQKYMRSLLIDLMTRMGFSHPSLRWNSQLSSIRKSVGTVFILWIKSLQNLLLQLHALWTLHLYCIVELIWC